MNTKKIGIEIHGLGIGDDFPVRVMGVINLSHESFYKSSFTTKELVASRAQNMIDAGATILDLGGRSTAPHAGSITVEEEKWRVVNALDALFKDCDISATLVSIDTQYSEVGIAAYDVFVKHGKEESFIINDVSCLVADSTMLTWVSEIGKPVIIMAGHAVPGDSLGIERTLQDLYRGIDKLSDAGFDIEKKLIIDPAIGRWVPDKEPRFDCELVGNLSEFRCLGKPVLAGISRKSFLGSILGYKEPSERLFGTLSATAIAVFNGAHIIRTHDVTKETMDTILLASAIRKERTINT